nr:pseudouridine synthase [Roseateles koreensis]
MACPAGPWSTVLDFLCERLPLVSRASWQGRLQAGDVLNAEGQSLTPDAPYRGASRVYYWRQLAHEPEIPFEASILFQDEWLLVADKPHFLPVVPAGRYVQQTLLTRLRQATGLATLTPAHRIDRETAGLVLFSIQPQTRSAYQNLFRDRAVSKVYEAIAPFKPTLSLPRWHRSRLAERADAFMQMEEVAGAVNAETEIRLLERLPSPAGDAPEYAGMARYELHPSTGQKHQLRAHMNALGLPILGDRIYPRLLPEQVTPDFSNPLQLLARELRFTDPITGTARFFRSELRLHSKLPT